MAATAGDVLDPPGSDPQRLAAAAQEDARRLLEVFTVTPGAPAYAVFAGAWQRLGFSAVHCAVHHWHDRNEVHWWRRQWGGARWRAAGPGDAGELRGWRWIMFEVLADRWTATKRGRWTNLATELTADFYTVFTSCSLFFFLSFFLFRCWRRWPTRRCTCCIRRWRRR